MREADRAVCRFRNELKCSGLPAREDAWRLAAHLADRVLVEVNDLPLAYTLPGPIAIITIPAGWDEEKQVRALLHEIGHAVLCPETPVYLACGEWGADRLLRLWEAREERQAREFVLAWLLPADCLLKLLAEGEEELAAVSGLSSEEVQERVRMLLP